MNKIYEILEQIRPEFDFRSSGNYINDEYLDSFDIVTLVSELELVYHVSIDGLDIIPENFETVETIKKLIVKSGGAFDD